MTSTTSASPREATRRRAATMLAAGIALSTLAACTAATPDDTVPEESTAEPADTADVSPDPLPDDPLADEALLAAEVPSICEFPAGRLIDGALEGVAPGPEGGVWLDAESVVRGGLGGSDVAAGVFSCDHGGVAWPDVVGVFEGDADTGTARVVDLVAPADLTRFDRESVESVELSDGVLVVRWWTGVEADAAAMGDSAASARFVPTADGLAAEDVTVRTAADTAQDFVDALNGGDVDAALALSAEPVASDVEVLVSPGETLSELTCDHRTAGQWVCTVLATGGTVGWYGTLSWQNEGWDTWVLTDIHLSIG